MKKLLFAIPAILIAICIVTACSSEMDSVHITTENKSDLISELTVYNNNISTTLDTRGSGPTVTNVSDATLEIVEADLIGALEGAYKGFDYAIDKELSQDEAIAVIVISAVHQAVARSHAAYVHNLQNQQHMGFAVPPYKNFLSNPKTFRENIVSLSVSSQVAHNYWMISPKSPVDRKYPNASLVGRKHNAILSVLDTTDEIDDYQSSLSLYSATEAQFILSQYHIDSFNQNISVSMDYSSLGNISEDDAHYLGKNITSLFLKAISQTGRNVSDYNNIMTEYINRVESSDELSALEKENLYISFFVGLSSMSYWTTEKNLK